jgi:hypothetical protein
MRMLGSWRSALASRDTGGEDLEAAGPWCMTLRRRAPVVQPRASGSLLRHLDAGARPLACDPAAANGPGGGACSLSDRRQGWEGGG